MQPITCTLIGLVGNALLSGGKLLIGILARSASLTADGFHSLADMASDIGVLLALRASRRPADRNHPYGHHSMESLGALGVSLLMLATACGIGYQAVDRLLSGDHLRPSLVALIAAVVSIALKEAMARYTYAAGYAHNSPVLLANAANHRSDALSSIAAAAGILGAMLGAPSLDSVAAMLIALLILRMGVKLIQENVLTLMDTMPEEAMLTKMRDTARGIEGVRSISALRVRQRGSRYLADLSITVDPELSVRMGHTIAHQVELAMRRRMPELAKVFVHVEPG